MKHLKQIEAYWERRMSPEEEEAFEGQLAEDAGLREEMKAYEASLRLLELAAREHPTKAKRPLSRLNRWAALAAALALLLAAALFAYANLNYSNRILAQSSYKAPIFSDIIRGEANASLAEEALSAFAAGHYPETIRILEAEKNREAPLSYLLAHAYYQQGSLDKAAALFSSLADGDNPYRQGAGWYLALAYLRSGKLKKAEHQLAAISQQPDNPNQARAAALALRLHSGWRSLVLK